MTPFLTPVGDSDAAEMSVASGWSRPAGGYIGGLPPIELNRIGIVVVFAGTFTNLAITGPVTGRPSG